jgi:hypothetical protein
MALFSPFCFTPAAAAIRRRRAPPPRRRLPDASARRRRFRYFLSEHVHACQPSAQVVLFTARQLAVSAFRQPSSS